MGFFRSLAGSVSVELTSADPSYALRLIQQSGMELRDVEQKDSLTLSFSVSRVNVGKLQAIAARRGDDLHTTARQGVFWPLKQMLHRPVLLAGLFLLLLAALTLPGRVLFVRVSGNTATPTRLILEKAAQCGVTLGASTREVRSEDMKNRLLSAVPGLQWAGVNTYGCVAVIDVKERAPEPIQQQIQAVTSIIAQRDGLILSITTHQGTALCKPGDAVVKGQKLISGFTDCGISIRAEQAKGEIVALTDRQITAVTPIDFSFRRQNSDVQRNFSLIIGKKRINFYKGSGILDTTCARIYSQWYVTLPGGFVLPLGILCEQYSTFETVQAADSDPSLSDFARQYVLAHSDAGEILSATETAEEKDGLLILYGRYACRENLGMIRIEEKLEDYGKDS